MKYIGIILGLVLLQACKQQYVCPSYDQSKVKSPSEVMDGYDKRK